MRMYWHRVRFENGVIDCVMAFNIKEATIKAQAKAINDGRDYTVKDVMEYVVDSWAYQIMEKDGFER